MNRFAALLLAVQMFGCNGQPEQCKAYPLFNAYHYQVRPTVTTPSGIAVDPTGQDIDMDKIERQTDEVEQCLIEAFGDPPKIPPDVMRDAQCVEDTFSLPIDRSCLTVKVPDDWLYSCDGTQLLLPVQAPEQGCLDKGLKPTPGCPCRWRGGTQDDRIIVTTPAFYIYKDPLIRVVTGCNNPWYHPTLAKCASPSVPPLP